MFQSEIQWLKVLLIFNFMSRLSLIYILSKYCDVDGELIVADLNDWSSNLLSSNINFRVAWKNKTVTNGLVLSKIFVLLIHCWRLAIGLTCLDRLLWPVKIVDFTFNCTWSQLVPLLYKSSSGRWLNVYFRSSWGLQFTLVCSEFLNFVWALKNGVRE